MNHNLLKIACLGWGALIWDHRELPIKETWFENGPVLPIEFLRISRDGRLTLVIDNKNGSMVRTLWTLLDCEDIEDAKNKLSLRESGQKFGKTGIKVVDALSIYDEINENIVKQTIFKWLQEMKLDGVVWTALPPKFDGENYKAPTLDQVINYLKNLNKDKQKKAEEYIRKAPIQINTKYRKKIIEKLGWENG